MVRVSLLSLPWLGKVVICKMYRVTGGEAGTCLGVLPAGPRDGLGDLGGGGALGARPHLPLHAPAQRLLHHQGEEDEDAL